MQKDVVKNELTVFVIGVNDYFEGQDAERERKTVDIELDYVLLEKGEKVADA